MTERIVDILQLLPATDWFFMPSRDAQKTWRLHSYEPVVVFALVTVDDDDIPDADVEKRALALGMIEFSELADLIGTDPTEIESRPLIYKTQIASFGVEK